MSDKTDFGNPQAILFRRGRKFKLAFCRGKPRCFRNTQLQSKIGPCPDCVIAENENETLGEFLKRMQRGDA